jgi:hypothetical protein
MFSPLRMQEESTVNTIRMQVALAKSDWGCHIMHQVKAVEPRVVLLKREVSSNYVRHY